MSIPIMNMAGVSLHVPESHNLSQNILQMYSIRFQPLNVHEGITSGACQCQWGHYQWCMPLYSIIYHHHFECS